MPSPVERSPYEARAAEFDPRVTERALGALNGACYVITSAYEGKRSGSPAMSVQLCASEPRLVCVAVRKGHFVEPLIRDSRAFAVCQVEASDRLLLRRFASAEFHEIDPFDGIEIGTIVTPSPVPKRSPLVIDCEVVRHIDIEADHQLYVGRVLAARLLDEGEDRAK